MNIIFPFFSIEFIVHDTCDPLIPLSDNQLGTTSDNDW